MSLVFPALTKATLIDVNPRSESHGDVKVPAIDLRFQVEMSNAVLALLHPSLRNLLYAESTQTELPGVDAVSECTELRFPELASPFTWKEEIEGNNLLIDYGLGGEKSDIRLSDCKLHKQKFDALKGGTCRVSFTLSCVHGLSGEVAGALALRVGHDMHIQLTACEPAAV
jgi:hypothetical protein